MLSRCVLSSCVRLSVTGRYYVETTGRMELGFWHAGFLLPIPHYIIRKFEKLGYFLQETVPNSGVTKFRHGKSIALSTKLVVVVDDGRVC